MSKKLVNFRIDEKTLKRLDYIIKRLETTKSDFIRDNINQTYDLFSDELRILIYDSKKGKIFVERVIKDPLEKDVINRKRFPLIDLKKHKVVSEWMGLSSLKSESIKKLSKLPPKEAMERLKIGFEFLSKEFGEEIKCRVIIK